MDNAHSFFSPEEQHRIELAVQAAEASSGGEIVPMLVTSSYDYPAADVIGGSSLALVIASLVSWAFGSASLWWFLPVFVITMPLFQHLMPYFPWLKRNLISSAEMTAEVKEKAMVSFLQHSLHQTRDHSGILILISLFERRVHVLADSGINARVPKNAWNEIVNIITEGLKNDDTCAALCRAIERCGALLEAAVPRREDDENELRDLIIEE